MPQLRGDLARWVAVLKSSDVKEVLSRMSSYYVNLGLLAALLGGFSVSLLASPCVSDGVDEYYRLQIAGVSGSFAACTFLPCVIDCVLIDNTIKMLPITEPAFLLMLEQQGTLLNLPKFLFFLGGLCMIVQVSAIVRLTYALWVFVVYVAVAGVTLLIMLRRYVLVWFFRSKVAAEAMRSSAANEDDGKRTDDRVTPF